MKKLEEFEDFKENNLCMILGGAFSYEPTRYENGGGADEHLITHESSRRYWDGTYNCEKGEFDWIGY